MMKLNQVYELTSEKFDVKDVTLNQKLLYFKEEGKIIIKSCLRLAVRDNEEKYGGRALIITASQAARQYPKQFFNSDKPIYENEKRTIMLKVPSDIYLHCCKQGCITDYIQGLIRKDMKKQERREQ